MGMIKICNRCGKEYESNCNRRQYCDECRILQRRDYERRSYENKMLKAKLGMNPDRAKRIAHQRDKSVWVPDYGEKQKEETIELFARIDVSEYETFSSDEGAYQTVTIVEV